MKQQALSFNTIGDLRTATATLRCLLRELKLDQAGGQSKIAEALRLCEQVGAMHGYPLIANGKVTYRIKEQGK